MAKESHPGNPQLQREVAFRSASLAAMTLMFAAQGMGLATGSVGGFKPLGVARKFRLSTANHRAHCPNARTPKRAGPEHSTAFVHVHVHVAPGRAAVNR